MELKKNSIKKRGFVIDFGDIGQTLNNLPGVKLRASLIRTWEFD